MTLVSCASSARSETRSTPKHAELRPRRRRIRKVLRENPDSRDARQGLERAKLRASQDHFTRARRLSATGKLEEALVEYQLAAELNPATRYRSSCRTPAHPAARQIAVREDGKTRLESLIAQSLPAPLPAATCPRTPSCPNRWSSATPAPGRLLRDRQVHQHQRGLRSGLSAISRCRSTCATRRWPRRSTCCRRPRATSGAPPATADRRGARHASEAPRIERKRSTARST